MTIRAGDQGLRQIVGAPVGGDLEHHAVAGWVENDRVTDGRRRGVYIRLAGQCFAVSVDNAHLIFFGEPPGNVLGEQAIERIDSEQHAGILITVEERYVDFDVCCVFCPVGIAVAWLTQLREFDGAADRALASVLRAPSRQVSRRHSVHRGRCRVQPQQLLEFRVALQDMPGAQREQRTVVLGPGQIQSELPQLFGSCSQGESGGSALTTGRRQSRLNVARQSRSGATARAVRSAGSAASRRPA
jgi:hypothetical protein